MSITFVSGLRLPTVTLSDAHFTVVDATNTTLVPRTNSGVLQIALAVEYGIYLAEITCSGTPAAVIWDDNAGTYSVDILPPAATATLDLAQVVPTSNDPNTVGDCMNAARAQGFGKWTIDIHTRILTLYAPDGSTAVAEFLLDSLAAPTSRTPQ